MISEKKDRPAYVRFERVAVEDKAASVAAGQYRARDVDFALVTAPYSRDVFKQEVIDWFAEMEKHVRDERIPPQWLEQYRAQYAAWKRGEELPLNGTPIKGWAVLSPAQQDVLIRMNVFTVEDAAAMNDEGLRRFGMGASEVRNKAEAWLKQAKDKGPLTMEIATVKAKNESLSIEVATLTQQVAALTTALQATQAVQAHQPAPAALEITANELLEDPVEAYTKKFGKPPHHRMKPETIRAALEA